MNIPYSEIIAGLIIATITGFSGKIFNALRMRQLYLVIDRPMSFPNLQRAGYTINVSVINKGKDKEEDIEVIFQSTKSIKLTASDYDAVSVKGNRIKIDRVLAGTDICFSVNVLSDYSYKTLPLPIIKSKDANGKTFKNISDVPLSGGNYVAGGMFAVCVISFMVLFPTIFDGASRLYSWYRYSDYESEGFVFEKYSDMTSVGDFSFKYNDIPVSLSSFTYAGNKATYEFVIKNKNLEEMAVEVDFIPRNKDYYYAQLDSIYQNYFKKDYDTYVKLSRDLRENYFRYEDMSVNINIPPMQSKKITITRKLVKGMSMDDMDLSIKLHLQGLKDYETTRIIFDNRKNKITDAALNDAFKRP